MGKVILWIVVVFAVLFALRLLNAAKAKRTRDASRNTAGTKPASAAMVRCVHCGIFLPHVDAKTAPDGFVCGDADCSKRH